MPPVFMRLTPEHRHQYYVDKLEHNKQVMHEYYLAHRDSILAATKKYHKAHPEKMRTRQAKARERFGKLMTEIKNKPCQDCNRLYPPYVMHFDHRDPTLKRYNVAKMRNKAVNTILAEVAKCDLVCANCHAERTFKQQESGVIKNSHYLLRQRHAV